MLVNEATRRGLAIRRERRVMVAQGWEEISCASGIGDLWKLDRGARIGERIVETTLGISGLSVWVRTEKPQA